MRGKGHIAVPDGGAGEMPRALGQCRAVRTLIDLHSQANGRDFQRSQMTGSVVQVLRHRCVCRCPVAAIRAVVGSGRVADGGRDNSNSTCADAAGLPGHKVRGQVFARVQCVAGGTAKDGRDERRTLAAVDVHAVIHTDIDGFIGSRSAEQPRAGSIKLIFQCGCGHRKSRHQSADGKQHG